MSFTASDASRHHADLNASQQQRWAEAATLMESAAAQCGLSAADAEQLALSAANRLLAADADVLPFPLQEQEENQGADESHIERLLEYTTSQGVRPVVDRRQGIIRGVKVLGLASRNGRSYEPAAIAAAARLYEGVKVNLNHPKASSWGPRDYQDRLGSLRHVCATDNGLFGDLHFNPKHPVAEQLAWDAEHAAENLGLSHNVEARTSRRGSQTVVEAIVKVNSVDLVADPATTSSLFEGVGAPGQQHAFPQHVLTIPAEEQAAPEQQVAVLVECLSVAGHSTELARRLAAIDGETLTLLTEQVRRKIAAAARHTTGEFASQEQGTAASAGNHAGRAALGTLDYVIR